MEKRGWAKLKAPIAVAAITCMLYGSGFMIMLTPLPIFFAALVYGKNTALKAGFWALLFAISVYMFGLPYLNGHVSSGVPAELIFMIPGAGLAKLQSVASAQYMGLGYFVYFLLFAGLFSLGITKKWKLTKWLTVSACGTFLLLIVAILIPGIMGFGIVENFESYIQSSFNEIVAAQETAGVSGDTIFVIKKNAPAIISFAISIIPAVVFLVGLFTAAVNLLFVRWFVKEPKKFSHFEKMSQFNPPSELVWVFISLGFFFFLGRYLLKAEWLNIITINGLIVGTGIYFLHGLLIINCFLARAKARFFKTLTYLMIFLFFQATAPVIAIIGFADLWVDFRRLLRKEQSKKGVSHGSNSA